MTATNKTITTSMKLANVFATIGSLEKDGHNDFNNFNYRSWESVVSHVKKALHKEGLAMRPSLISAKWESGQGSKSDSILTSVHIRVEFVSFDGEAEDVLGYEWFGQGMDKLDLGIGKATSYALKDFLIKFFLLPDDPQHESDATAGTPQTNPNPQPARTPASNQQQSADNTSKKASGSSEGNISPGQVKLIWAKFGENFDMRDEVMVHDTATEFYTLRDKRAPHRVVSFENLHWTVAKPLIDALCDTPLDLRYNKGKNPDSDIISLAEAVQRVVNGTASAQAKETNFADDGDSLPF